QHPSVKQTSPGPQSKLPLHLRNVQNSWTQTTDPSTVETQALPAVKLSQGSKQPWNPGSQVSGLVGTQKPAAGSSQNVPSGEQTNPSPHPLGMAAGSHASSPLILPSPHTESWQ